MATSQNLDAILFEQILRQDKQLLEDRGDALECNACGLLNTFRDGIGIPTQDIDVVYVLKGGLKGREYYVEPVLGELTNELHFNPRAEYDPEQRVPVLKIQRGNPSANHSVLIVENSWLSGDTFRKTLSCLESADYQRDKIYVFYFLGSGGYESVGRGFVTLNPVLLSGGKMLEFFDSIPTLFRNPRYR